MENLVTRGDLHEAFNGKKVFITGHTGFKGAWLTACLHTLGATLKGYALAPEYENSLFHLLEPLEIIEHFTADIRNKDVLTQALNSFNPDFIFHLAAQPLVRRSYEIPTETFAVNVVGTANLLEAATKLTGKCTIVVITTDKVYENKETGILYKEADALGGYDPYSASKACTELVVNSFRNSFFNLEKMAVHQKAVAVARAGNVIGGGDWSDNRIVPDIVRSINAHETIQVRNPSSVRPWQHVLEPLTGYMQLAAKLYHEPLEYSKPYNFGPLPDDHLSVRELVETAIACLHKGSWKDISDPSQPHEAGLLKLDISRAMRELNWQPKLDAKTAVEWTMRWYDKSLANQKDYTFQQINDYFSL